MKIFRYNKEGLLTDFVSKDTKGHIDYLICLKNNLSIKYIKECMVDATEDYKEVCLFKDNVRLYTEYMLGEYWIRTILHHPILQSNPSLSPKRDVFMAGTTSEITNFSVKSSFIDEWSNKLKSINL